MKRKIKMLLYGEPGVGKSVFANKAEKRFFITTDGNYEWLGDFGAKAEDHKQVSSWKEFLEFVHDDKNFEGYDTIVIDLLEDLFNWNEHEFVKKNKLEHIGDMGYGKGYGITRDEFFIEISKVIAKPKHIILLMHESKEVVKDRRGVESTIYKPHRDLPETLLGKIEGRLRFVMRAYMQDIENQGVIKMRRMLSVSPKPNEYGILRGVKDIHLQEDIPLDWDAFMKLIDSSKMTQEDIEESNKKKHVISTKSVSKVVETKKVAEIQEEKAEEKAKVDDKKAEMMAKLAAMKASKENPAEEETIEEEIIEDVVDEEVVVDTEEIVEPEPEVKPEPKKETTKKEKPKVDKMLAIRAKLRAVRCGAKGEEHIEKTVQFIIENQSAHDDQIKEFISKL